MEMVNVKINGMEVSVPKGSTVLDAAHAAGIEIPTLCYMREINEIGACRICVVEVKGARGLVTACVYPVTEGMEITTNSEKIRNYRRMTLEMILSTHDRRCLTCVRSGECELQKLCRDYGVENADKYDGERITYEIDTSSAAIVRDNNKCILCRRCVAACKDQAIGVIGANDRGFDTHIGTAFDAKLGDVACVNCGQCIVNCPVGALYEKDSTADVWKALADPGKKVIVHTAPSVRAALGEEFGLPMGTNVEGKMAAALRRLGFYKVFDTDVAADVTIVEEATELVNRIKNGGVLPMITSCSPGWVKYCEHYFPDEIDHISSCKSPQQMMGAIIKTYYAKKEGIDPKDMYVVSVMPCVAKKFEIGREDQDAAGVPDNDASITTRELAQMIRRAGINFNALPDEKFDDPIGDGSGAGVIFGATGGVMEAALRTASEWLTGKPLEKLEFEEVRGTKGIKEAAYRIGDLDLKVAVASGTKNAKTIMEKIAKGEADYAFVEIMCCPGGCVNGGGQPHVPASVKNFTDVRAIRASALYSQDAAMTLRKSHESPAVKAIYDEYFGEYGSHKAHEALHTTYVKRGKY